MKKPILSMLAICLFLLHTQAQDPTRFEKQIDEYRSAAVDAMQKEVIVFTGSSSVRMWKDVDDRFPAQYILNRGFGGSQMSDLIYYLDELVLKLKPVKVFIYEGDNDISAGKNTKQILKDTKVVLKRIKKALPATKIYIIAAKPSIARWELRNQYKELNAGFEKLAAKKANLNYIDVWTPMITGDGEVMKDIFIEDGLHMNRKGYDIWTKVIAPFVQ